MTVFAVSKSNQVLNKKKELKAIEVRISESLKTEKELKKKLSNKEDLDGDIKGLEKVKESLKQSIDKMKGKLTDLEKDLNVKIRNKKVELESLEKDYADKEDKYLKTSLDLKSEKKELDKIRNQASLYTSKKEEELDNIEAVLVEKEKYLADLNKRLSTVLGEAAKAEKERNKLFTEVNKSEEKIEILGKEFVVLEASVLKLKEEEVELVSSIAKEDQKIKDAYADLSKIKDEFTAECAVHSDLMAGREGEVSRKIVWVEESRAKLNKIKGELEDIHKKPININI